VGALDYLIDQRQMEWQTKSFPSPSMDRYRITNEGRLEKGEPPAPTYPYSEDARELLSRWQEVVERSARWTWTKQHFSGPIRAYALGEDGHLRWAEFVFEDGVLLRTDPPTAA
jgi:hypothetical protein